ncbi:hypothetical protein LZC95_04015 [Pendulispora brunnea]|uniref:DUF4350 domain-containing protein n=1 Tax=Pendulispora brunnea TaxID=2905690 RepID=A0ABZ2KBG8_9BACT
MRVRAGLVTCLAVPVFLMGVLGAPAQAGRPRTMGSSGLLDPARAEKDAPNVLRENNAFCKEPSRPLSFRARSLCTVAERIPNCEGFTAACAAEQHPVTPEKQPEGDSGFLDALKRVLGQVATIVIYLLIGAVMIAILLPLLRVIVRSRKDKALADQAEGPKVAVGMVPPPQADLLPEDDAEVLLRRADGHAQQGNLEAALFTYLNASLRALDKRGAIRIARHRTNGEYVRACSEAETKEPLYAIVRDVDRVQFGGARPTPDIVARTASRATAIVRTAAAVASTLMLAVLVGGCSLPSHGGRASDPAGQEILADLLQWQGVTVRPLGSSLASVPLPDPEQAVPQTYAILVDTDRTPLETTTELHLMRWVRGGGFLVLAGAPVRWPDELGAAMETSTSSDIEVESLTDDGTTRTDRGRLVHPAAVRFKEALPVRVQVARTGDDKWYAAYQSLDRGRILTIASSDFLMNAQLAQPANAAAMVSILRLLDRAELRLALPQDGISPPSNPITALERSGLGLALYHALAATLVLFVAVGVRLSRARPNAPQTRRAFTEHIEATGTFYHRRRAASHALAAYARYAEERVRQRLPRGNHDVGAWLGQRSGVSVEECTQIWQRATSAQTAAIPQGDELFVLKRLSAIVSLALRLD